MRRRHKKEKRGSALLSDEMIGLLLAVGGIILLVFLFFKIFTLGYDPHEETLKSYSRGLARAIAEVKEYGHSEFSPIPNLQDTPQSSLPDNGVAYFLVYFGSLSAADLSSSGEHTMSADSTFTRNYGRNRLCMCISRVDIHRDPVLPDIVTGSSQRFSCGECVTLDGPLAVNGAPIDIYHIPSSFRFIKRQEGYYMEVTAGTL